MKPQKKIKYDKKTSVTLDGKHREILNDLDKDECERIPDIKNEINEISEKLKKSTSFEQKIEFEETIHEKRKKVSDLKKRRKEYLLDNSKLIFDYFISARLSLILIPLFCIISILSKISS
jgi:hypothetical protein